MDAATLEKRLNERADAELESAIDQALKPAWDLFQRYYQSRQIPGSVTVELSGHGKITAYAGAFFGAYQKALFLSLQEANRAMKIDAFIDQVESVQNDIANAVSDLRQD